MVEIWGRTYMKQRQNKYRSYCEAMLKDIVYKNILDKRI